MNRFRSLNGRILSILAKPLFLILLISSFAPAVGKNENSTISGRVSDQDGNPLSGVTIEACDLNKQPVLLIPGGAGTPSLSEDTDGLWHIYQWMRAEGYLEGCNLFFANTVSGFISREDNRKAVQAILRQAHDQMVSRSPDWGGHFDIIGHSFGGLIARFYLESGYYSDDQAYGEQGIHIDNLFTLGTPHGGTIVPAEVYPGAMIIAGEYIFNPADFEEFLGVAQLFSPAMDLYNMLHRQPPGTRYHLLGGDFLQQDNVPLAVQILYLPYSGFPGDVAVSLRSAGQLAISPLLQALYPQTCLYFNEDFHGYTESFDLGGLKSYVYPQTTYQDLIARQIGSRAEDCPAGAAAADPSFLAPDQQPFIPPVQVAAAQLSASETLSGSFSIDWQGETSFTVLVEGGRVDYAFRAPDGRLLSPQTIAADQQLLHDTTHTPSAELAAFILPDITPGEWEYTLQAQEGSAPASVQITAYHNPQINMQRLLGASSRAIPAHPGPSAVQEEAADRFQAKTGEDGRFTFSDLPAGSYLIRPAPGGMSFDPPAISLTLPPSASDLQFTLLGDRPDAPYKAFNPLILNSARP